MTAKQKSEELIKKYISTYKRWDVEYLNLNWIFTSTLSLTTKLIGILSH